jgi:hypothetical protein
MKADHLEFLVEEPSMEVFLRELLPRALPSETTFQIHVHRGKPDLMKKLPSRLLGYAKCLPQNHRIVVLVDRDGDRCGDLKARIEQAATSAGLLTRSLCQGQPWRVVSRIAIEELEAWFFGEWNAVRRAYPRVLKTVPAQTPYRDPDAVAGGTWEALERIFQRAGYFDGGLRKLELAGNIGRHLDPARSRSASFKAFLQALHEATV